MAAPLALGEPFGYVHPDRTQHVNYVGDDNHIHELWWNGPWHHNDLTVAAAAPAPFGQGTVVFGYAHPGDGTQHVNFLGADTHVHELWWDGDWHHNDLTVAAAAPNIRAMGVGRGYVHPGDGTQHVIYRGQDRQIHELRWAGGWSHHNLTAEAGAPLYKEGPSGGYVHPDGTQHVTFAADDDLIHELWWDGRWHHANLSMAARAPIATTKPSGGYVSPDGTQHVNYIEFANNHIHELWWDGGWHDNDLTDAAGAPPEITPERIRGGYAESNGIQHVDYLGPDNHIHELWWDGDWHHRDLSATVAAGALAEDVGLGYIHPDGTQHVNYLGRGDQHVYELWSDNSWHSNDLTLATVD